MGQFLFRLALLGLRFLQAIGIRLTLVLLYALVGVMAFGLSLLWLKGALAADPPSLVLTIVGPSIFVVVASVPCVLVLYFIDSVGTWMERQVSSTWS
jgi:hypothetical protein